jgi:hypothetical protein
MKPGTSADRRGPWGLLGAFCLILAIESTVAHHAHELTTPPRLEWRESRRAAGAEARNCQILGLGTSMTKLGFYPSVVERESGLRTYNLASCAGRLPGSYFLLRRVLDGGANPEAVVLEVHPSYLAIPFQEGLVAWPDLLGPAESLELAWTARDPSFFASTTLARYLPTLAARPEIRAAILDRLRGEVGSIQSLLLAHQRNLDHNAGAFVQRRATPYQGEVTPYLAGMYLNPAWSADRVNVIYLRRLLDLCKSRRIPVYWLIPPLVPELQARRESVGLEEAYNRFARRIQRSYPDLTILDARKSGYQPPVFSDAAHLDFPGAVAMSAEVGRIVKAGRVGGSRWIDLPAYHEQPVEPRLEDIAQSIRATNEAGIIR